MAEVSVAVKAALRGAYTFRHGRCLSQAPTLLVCVAVSRRKVSRRAKTSGFNKASLGRGEQHFIFVVWLPALSELDVRISL